MLVVNTSCASLNSYVHSDHVRKIPQLVQSLLKQVILEFPRYIPDSTIVTRLDPVRIPAASVEIDQKLACR